MKKKIFLMAGLALAMSVSLSGCAEPEELKDGYQLGDMSHLAVREQAEVRQAVKDYCDKHRDSAIRYAALNIIRLKFPFIPENGICGTPTDPPQLPLAQENGAGG